MFVRAYWQVIYWSIILSFLFSHIERLEYPYPPCIEHGKSPLRVPPPSKFENSNLSLSPSLPLCLYLIFYFFTHHTQTKPGRPGALQEKEVSTISLLCVYAYVYFYIILYYIRLHTLSRYYFLIYCVLKIWKLFIQDIFE